MMMLPPGPRDLWSQLEAEKEKAGPADQILYLQDPFISQAAKLQIQQQYHQQALQEQAKARTATPTKADPEDDGIDYGPSEYARISSLGGNDDEAKKKEWDKLPMVHMNQEMRTEVEDVVKKQMAGELYQTVWIGVGKKLSSERSIRLTTYFNHLVYLVYRRIWITRRANVQHYALKGSYKDGLPRSTCCRGNAVLQ